jgi:hypothetical protein
MNLLNLSEQEAAIYEEAKELLKNKVSAAEFGKFFWQAGPLGEIYDGQDLRKDFIDSPLYKWLQGQLHVLQKKEAADFRQLLYGRDKDDISPFIRYGKVVFSAVKESI